MEGKMKILIVINSLATGGAEKLVAEMLPLYEKAGLNADLLLLNDNDHPFLDRLKDHYTGKIFSLGKGSVYNPMHSIRLSSHFKNYDVIHVHLFPALYWAAFAKMISFSSGKMVFTEHSTSNKRRGKLLFRIFDKIAYSMFSKIVCISNEVKNDLQNHLNLQDDKFAVIGNGVNLHTISNATGYQKSELNLNGKYVMMQVSSFRYPKDQLTLVKALRYLPENMVLCLVGEGENLEAFKDHPDVKEFSNRIFFLGQRLDVAQLMKTADVNILSSAYEGVSLSAIEAMASGKPFVASDVRGLNELAGGAALLFPYQDEKAFAEVVSKIRNNDAFANEISQACMNRAAQYDINATVSAHVELYKSLR